MKQANLLLKSLVLGLVLCLFAGKASAKPTDTVTANITVNTYWDSSHIYYIKGYVYVTSGAVLTIQQGTLIEGAPAPNLGALIISVGCQIQAVGSPAHPIVFTSSKKPGLRQRGDWGGLILLGHSGHNYPITVGGITSTGAYIEGITPNPYTLFGPIAGQVVLGLDAAHAEDDHDNSGTLKYVRCEFAGYALSPNNEINGITFGAVGDGTTIDHVQVSYANDDSYEWFGGTVNCTYLIAFRGIDDDFDTDNGFSGQMQFGMGLRDPQVADQSQSAGFEVDNNADGFLYTPRTNAIFTNYTVTAGNDTAFNYNALFKGALHDRRAAHEYVINSILVGYPQGFEIDGSTTNTYVSGNNGTTQGTADTLAMNDLVTVSDTTKWVTTPSAVNSTQAAATVAILKHGASNRFSTNNSLLPMLTSPYTLTNPDYRPAIGSLALAGNTYSEAHSQLYNNGADTFFMHSSDGIDYVGAFDAVTDWTKPWANFDPVNGNSATSGEANKCKGSAIPKLTVPIVTPAVCKTGKLLVSASQGVSNLPYEYLWYTVNGTDSTLIDSTTNNKEQDLAPGQYAVKVLAGKCYSAPRGATVNLLKPKFAGIDNTGGKFGVSVNLGTIYTAMSGYSYQIRFADTVNGTANTWSPWGGNNKANTYFNGQVVDSIWRYAPSGSFLGLTPASLFWEYFTHNPYYNTSNPNNLGGRDTGLVATHTYVFEIHGRCFSSNGHIVFSDSLKSGGTTLGTGVILSKKYKVPGSYAGKGGVNTSIADNSMSAKSSSVVSVNIYPNPSKGSFNVDLSGFNADVNIQVIDLNGRIVNLSKHSISGKSALVSVNAGNLSPGIYTVQISDGINTVSKKLTIVE